MALESQPGKALENPVKDLKVGVTSKENEGNMIGAKDGNTSDATSCISSGDPLSSIKEREVNQEAFVAEQTMYYTVNGVYGYYYPGFDGSMGDWDGNGYIVGTDGLEIQYSANQSENGSLVYYFPGVQAGYYPYSPVSPGAVVGVDGQYFTQQLYHTSPILHQPPVSTGFFPQSIAYGPELVPAYVWNSASTCIDGLHGNGYSRDSPAPYPKPYFSSQNHAMTTSKTVPSRSSVFGKKAAADEMDLPRDAAMQNHAFKLMTKVNNELSKSFHPTNKVHSIRSPGKGILQYPSMASNGKSSGRTWVGIERHKAANQPHGSGDILNEQNGGPRTLDDHGAWISSYAATTDSEANNNSNCILVASIKKEDYNLAHFPINYDHALFFVIKSYSEDNIHKSIKYNVWASTANGNKKLDHAFQGAQEKTEEKRSKCPVFLFFSVNASGQFCGVAEMIGRVDFSKNMDFWKQDKWTGYFPVKWHIIKNIPNPQFRHIILENNENKPVTNSRDTQEVKFLQGSEMLNIFKNYSAKTSILEGFGFYESRQKTMQDKRIKPVITKLENLTYDRSLQFRSEAIAKFTKPTDQKTISSSPQLLEEADAENKEGFHSDLVQQ